MLSIHRLVTAASLTAAILLAGCNASQQRRSEPAQTQPAATEAPAAKRTYPGRYHPDVPNGYGVTELAFPTGDIGSSALLVHEVLPLQVRAGQPYSYDIHVTNLTDGTLQNVLLASTDTQNTAMQSASPAPTKGEGGRAQWFIGDLRARQTQVVRVTAKSDKPGQAGNCVTVSYNNSLCAVTQVVEPALALTKVATPEALVCDTIVIRYEVKNSGTGLAENVRVTDTLAEGLTVDGRNTVNLDAGTLKAGESRVLTVNAKAAKTGTFESPASAAASGGLTAKAAAASTVVRQPMLTLTCKGSDRVFIGRDATFEFTVKNTGNGPSNNTTVSVPLPAGVQLVRASDGGSAAGGRLTWNVGSLPAGQAKTVAAIFRATEATNIRMASSAQGVCAPAVTSTCETAVVGIPALLLDGNDDPDPVQIGENTTYTLTVTNQGSAPLTNVRLVCTMEGGSMQYVSQSGPTQGQVDGNTITFAPIATLAPKARATFKVVVKATKEGQVQFKGEASSAEITRALVKTETTNFYK